MHFGVLSAETLGFLFKAPLINLRKERSSFARFREGMLHKHPIAFMAFLSSSEIDSDNCICVAHLQNPTASCQSSNSAINCDDLPCNRSSTYRLEMQYVQKGLPYRCTNFWHWTYRQTDKPGVPPSLTHVS